MLDLLEIAKWVFASAYVLSTIGVAIGVYWENEKFDKVTQHRGWKLLIISLALDTFFTIIIFGIDGWISHVQRGEIITLENRLAARSLSDVQVDSIANRLLWSSGGQEFDIVTYWKNPESLAFTNRLYIALQKAGWKYIKPSTAEFLLGVQTGVLVWFDNRADATVAKAGRDLVAALTDNGIDAAVDDQPQSHSPNEPVNAKITINVGIKP